MIASLGLPHWLMIAGTLLVVAGFVGVLVSGKKVDVEDPPPNQPTDAPRQQMPPLPSLLDSRPESSTPMSRDKPVEARPAGRGEPSWRT